MAVAGSTLGLTALWFAARPAGWETSSFLGQLLGALAVLLMSIALVLVSTLPWVDTYFDGIDRALIWHRSLTILGLLLLVPHVLLSAGRDTYSSWAGPVGIVSIAGLVLLIVWAILPRWRSFLPATALRIVLRVRARLPLRALSRLVNNYEVWRSVHRSTGLFVAIGFAHGLADGTVLQDAPVLRWSYVGIGGTGLLFYLYRELFARRGHGLRDYQVDEVRSVAAGYTEVVLRPLGQPFSYTPGQFALLHLESKSGWHRHPFTLSGSPSEGLLRVTVKALGDYTSSLESELLPGMPAVIGGPHGRFDHAKGTARQVWVAGGVGITPFLSWLRSWDEHPPPGEVHLYYSSSDGVPYESEVRAIAESHASLTVTIVRTREDGRLTADRMLQGTAVAASEVSVFMCGPGPMVSALREDFRRAGVPGHQIHREHFDWR